MMKSMLYFLLALTTVLALAATASGFDYEPVLDTSGKKVIGGRSYYLIPAVPGKGGGLEWWNNVESVPQSESLHIEMDIWGSDANMTCCRQTSWKVDGNYDKERKQFFVMASSKDRFSSSTFDLKKTGDAYKIMFCPSIDCAASNSKLCGSGCSDIGIFVDEKGVRRLAFSSKPHLVKFKRFVPGLPQGLSKTI
ncbi:unnamed protein product [Microthlaspi erraticum]|uniref:Uncharacterized protein n=1 Tax=Microthlaspi erraticum TaxID=1685480 RepID=A0A6D2JUV6_9BRAS|nr:unnamed protein product [Microthlaspi erraticum]